ncbi:DUF305 domain-containing protein [Gordonia jinghuaiqii]|uniref:DUF305 domain-containing protein n=1 Tax=Gordonia jinghuaiqii TaxID=2758710 RepID=A0A7D7LYX8_9ACTN|nr:DUF305 domain-containing protein [Gordonia jinghuaiqii]MCR5977598.1 DUF305 domain-containing protein [Gordonia jinghuaiqii]QMT02276.1 DUF305 domain-containing protein [Gordonia jinghuaiqii]
MSGRLPPAWLRMAGAASVAVLLLAIGVVVGSAWSPLSPHDDAKAMNPADIGFAQDMSTHHDQAILMARSIVAAPGVDPEIRGLADKILVAQTAEAATMRGWLQFFGHPMSSDSPMSWMPTDSHGHHADRPPQGDRPPMPGLASIDELGRLTTLVGLDAEKLFLQLMIRHHQGGLSMAQAAYNDDRAGPATKQLALAMIGDQGNEIGQMLILLKDRGAGPLPT